jgi:hypothetical protein
MTDETPVLDTLADITVASVEHNSLAARELMLVRLAALIAVGAPSASYLANAGAAADRGVTADDIQGVMIGVPGCGHGAGGLGRREDPQGPGLRGRCGRLRDGRRRRRRAVAATRPHP